MGHCTGSIFWAFLWVSILVSTVSAAGSPATITLPKSRALQKFRRDGSSSSVAINLPTSSSAAICHPRSSGIGSSRSRAAFTSTPLVASSIPTSRVASSAAACHPKSTGIGSTKTRAAPTSTPRAASTLTSSAILTTSSASSTSTSSTTSSTATTTQISFKEACHVDGQNNKTWQALNMPQWVQFRGDEIPATNTASFLKILANYAGAEDVECVIADGGVCQLTGTSQSYCTSSAQHAYDSFAANAAINAAELGNVLVDSVWEAGFNTSLLSDDFVADFSPQNVVHDITNEIVEVLTVGLISVVGAFLTPFLAELFDMAAVASLFDILSSHESVINFATDTLTSASEIALKDFALETDLGIIVENELSVLSSGIQTYFDGIINGPAYNDPADYDYYATNRSGLPQLLASGTFAAPVTTKQEKRIEESTNQGFIGANILTVYELEGVYVIATNYTEAYGSHSCSTKLTHDLVRVCNGDTAYFFLKAAYTYPLNGASEIVGIDKLSNYQLSLLDIAIATEFSYEQQGYDKWTTSSAIKTLTTMQMPNQLFSHLPYCRLTAADFKDIYKREDVPEVEGKHCTQGDAVCRLKTAAYVACPKQKTNGKSFPLTFSK